MRKGLLPVMLLLLIPLTAAHEDILPHDEPTIDLPPGVLKIIEYRNQIAASITFLVAFLAGIISFTSPCGFVVLPTFIAFLFKERKKAALMTAYFCIGLTLAFTALGFAAAMLGQYINQFKQPFAILSGVIFIIFGIMMFFNKGFALFQFKLNTRARTGLGMMAMGFFFALGWTPCTGPVLGGILLLAANAGTVMTGTAYLTFFALGVSLPLLLVALLADKYDLASKKWIQGKLITFKFFGKEIVTHTYNLISAFILIFIGVVMIIWKGTYFFEIYVPWLVPWTMDLFYNANDYVTQTAFFTSGWSQFIGFTIGALVLALIVWAVRKRQV